ncbi:MAG TPA: hypothetical protein VIV58_20385 [Kofleriaceae bacterium]
MKPVRRLRALLPSWRFFDRATVPPRLYVRAVAAEWQPVAAPPRRAWSWAFSPRGNLALAEQSTVEHLVAEVDELDPGLDHDAPAITSLVSYELVARIARAHAPAGPWQWKIVVDREGEVSDYLVSPELAAA